MTCYVLRCDEPIEKITTLEGLGVTAPTGESSGMNRYDIGLCTEHHLRLSAGEGCEWIDEDRVLVVGTDLDSGGIWFPLATR